MSNNEKKRPASKADEKKPKRMNPVEASASAALLPIPTNNAAKPFPHFRYDSDSIAVAPPLPNVLLPLDVNAGAPPFPNVAAAPPLPNANVLLPWDVLNAGASPFPNVAAAPPLPDVLLHWDVNAGAPLFPNIAAALPPPLPNADGPYQLPTFGNVYGGDDFQPAFGNINDNFALAPLNHGGADVNGLNYCDNNGSDLKDCPDDHKYDDDDDDDDNVNNRSRAQSDYFLKKVRCGETDLDKFKHSLLTYANGGNKSPIQCYVGWKKDEAVGGEYHHPVFWFEYADGDQLGEKVQDSFSSGFFKDIAAVHVNKSDPRYMPRDNLIMYHIYHSDNPPKFDQREAFKNHVQKKMRSGDFVAITLNQSDDSVEEHKVTNNKNKKYANAVNGNTYKVFHLKNVTRQSIGLMVRNIVGRSGSTMESAGKDCGTVYHIYTKL
eukprot:scaffold2_cov132-Skeletonema_menzelii.AAC.7